MAKIIFILTLGFFINFLTFGQQEKIYYDSEWKVCSKSFAQYYRVITIDEFGKPQGIVRDYYITGEIQWEGYLSSFDKKDNGKDVKEGVSIWYFKNGKQSQKSNYVKNQLNGLTTFWYENGNKAQEVEYNMGIPDGVYIDYYENGNVYQKVKFNNGELSSQFFIECDEFQNCQKVFYEKFSKELRPNKWGLDSSNIDFKTEIIDDKGLLMQSKIEHGFKETLHIPLNLENDFSIETIIDFKSGNLNSGHGLVWGFKDWDNYYYFYITASGYFLIGSFMEGIDLKFAEWTQSNSLNKNIGKNLIKILRVNDKMYFSINGDIVHSDDFYSFKGNQIGFSFNSGKKEVLFENLIVRQDINDISETSGSSDIDSGWKGNGTGFFIDKTGYIATNYHVVKEANELEVEFIRNGIKQSFPAIVVQSDKQNDISIIRINSQDFNPFDNLPYNFKTNLSDVGSTIFALGYPLALSLMGTEIKFTDGKISSKTGIQGDITTYQISVPIQPGNSGGPLFDYDGNLIGITSSGIDRELNITENVNYAIKSSYLKNLVDVLDFTLTLPNDKLIANKTLTEKIKILSDFVVLIKIK